MNKQYTPKEMIEYLQAFDDPKKYITATQSKSPYTQFKITNLNNLLTYLRDGRFNIVLRITKMKEYRQWSNTEIPIDALYIKKNAEKDLPCSITSVAVSNDTQVLVLLDGEWFDAKALLEQMEYRTIRYTDYRPCGVLINNE